MTLKEKEVEIEGEKYVIKRWTVAEKSQVQDSIVADGDRKLPSLNTVITTLKTGLKSAPFELTDESLKNIDGAVADQLFIQIFQFNTIPFGSRIPSGKPTGDEPSKDMTQTLQVP